MRKLVGAGLVGVGLALAIGVTPAAAQKEKKIKRDTYVITAEEIATKEDITNAEEAVKRLRPQWLRVSRSKGSLGGAAIGGPAYRPASKNNGSEDNPAGSLDQSATTANDARSSALDAERQKQTEIAIYLDDVKQPSMDELRNIRVAEIVEMRFLSGTQATSRYGDGHASGAILIKSNRLGGS
ncbi:MAG: hypothetical protein R2882_10580 [Gemmatimonadales bacterium]